VGTTCEAQELKSGVLKEGGCLCDMNIVMNMGFVLFSIVA
jgi:hypothetical protein